MRSDRLDTQGGQHAEVARLQQGATVKNLLTRLHVFASSTHGRAGFDSGVDGHDGGVVVGGGLLDHHDGVGALG